MKELHLALLLCDLSILGDGLIVNDYFTNLFNDFIRDNYQNNKELFSILFDKTVLEEHINKGKHQIISQKYLLAISLKYGTETSFLSLLDKVGLEVDSKLNEIALLFVEYYYKQSELLTYIETPYVKILQ